MMFCYCSQCPSMYLLRDQLAPKGYTYATALHHGLQASSTYVFTFGHLLAFVKFVESVNCSYLVPILYKSS